ncbi:MAG: hypothetical protein R3E32_28090 [Chitinophagales bacterium]
MKTLIRTFICYLSLFFCCIFLHNCCTYTYQITGGGEIEVYNSRSSSVRKADTIKQDFILILTLTYEQIRLGMQNNFGIISNSFANSCGETYENKIVESSLILKCDKDFIYEGVSISANSNLTSLPNLETRTFRWGGVTFYFMPEFIEKAQFQKGEHTFTIEVDTDDQLHFQNEVSVYVDL